jgi:cation diffusion facilitator CzcD-associated flavoprotein CzcO
VNDGSREHFDVLIVGAGLSGIGAAHHIQDALPGKSCAILEARDAIGGTWDLFRYPGVRSDSDMFTLGYRFRPWPDAKAIADGPAILDYVRDTASDGDIERHIRFHHRVVEAEWSTKDRPWTVTAERTDTGETVELTCGFLFGCTGYYRYDEGYTPEFEGTERFQGQIVHPQHWPEDLDYSGKRVVVIGSGATAVTLVPAMTDRAEHVTMLQRSPSYIVSLPAIDPIARFVRRILPDRLSYPLLRWKNALLQLAVFNLSRRRPKLVKALIRRGVERRLPPGFDVDKHFRPPYNPWDQRMCLVPDADLFDVLADGSASIATDRIETFTESGIRLESGAELEADVVVTATGLNLVPMGGIQLAVNGRDVSLPETMAYKGMMLEGVPNFAFAVGYTNASWTLKCELTCDCITRLLRHMRDAGWSQCTPVKRDGDVSPEPLLGLTSGYVQRAIDRFPKQGARDPWRVHQSYLRDYRELRLSGITDEAMVFSNPVPEPVVVAAAS